MDINITTLSTPGTGSEVLQQALKCLDAISENFDHNFTYTHLSKPLEGGKIILSNEDIQLLKSSNAVLSSVKITRRFELENPELKHLTLTDALDLYVSIKATLPLKNLGAQGVFKEDLAALYEFILFKANPTQKEHSALKLGLGRYKYSENHIEKMIHLAFRTAKNRKKKLTLINPDHLEDSNSYWQNTVKRIGQSYPSVSIEIISIAKAVEQMLVKSKEFDILLSDHFLGEILAAQSKALTGTAALLPEAHDGIHCNLFEPLISIPKALESDRTNPLAAIYAATLLLSRFGLNEEALSIMRAIQSAININMVDSSYQLTENHSCSTIGDYLSEAIKDSDDVYNFNIENIGLGRSTII